MLDPGVLDTIFGCMLWAIEERVRSRVVDAVLIRASNQWSYVSTIGTGAWVSWCSHRTLQGMLNIKVEEFPPAVLPYRHLQSRRCSP